MENKNKIQYALAFSAILILVFQSFSNVLMQSVYAQGIDYLSDSNLTGRTIQATARTSSYLWVLHTSGSSGGLRISVYNATMGYAHFMTWNAVINGTGCSSVPVGLNVLPTGHGGLQDIIFSCLNGSLYRYSVVHGTGISAPYIGTSGIYKEAPCTTIWSHITLTDNNEVAYTCPNEHIVGIMKPITMSLHRIIAVPTNECNGRPYNNYADESQEVMVIECVSNTSGVSPTVVLYDMPDPLGFNKVAVMNLTKGLPSDNMQCSHDLGRCVIAGTNDINGVSVFQYNVNSAIPSGQLTFFGHKGTVAYHRGLIVTDESSLGSIAISGASNRNLDIIGLNRNETVDPAQLGSLLCVTSIPCTVMGISGSTSFYHMGDDETFYFATYSGHAVGILNITGFEQATDNDDDLNGGSTAGGSSGNTTGGTTGGSGSNSTNTCDFNNSSCTIPKQIGHGLCIFHLFDCDSNNDIKTNGVGFLLLIAMLGLLIVFFAILRKKANLQIHPIIWVGGMLAVFGLAVGAQLIEGYWFILAIVVIVAFGGFNVWNSRRQQ